MTKKRFSNDTASPSKKDMEQIFLQRVTSNRWIPINHRLPEFDSKGDLTGKGLTDKQVEFLAFMGREGFFGGAAGGGKSDALLMAALMFVEEPNYNALILRKTFPDLALAGAIMDRAHSWLGGTEAHWDGTTYHFPSGATLTFGYMQTEKDKYRYQSAEFQFIGFDEVTQFTEAMYTFMFSRLRKADCVWIPLRMRCASNPGNIGHDWVKKRFIVEPNSANKLFIPSKIEDNPNLNREEYIGSLRMLDPITRARYLEGNWDIIEQGMFKEEWFTIVNDYPKGNPRTRYWDLAATEKIGGNDPDYTAGVLITAADGKFYVLNVKRFQKSPHETEQIIKSTSILDRIQAQSEGQDIAVVMEEEGGSSGKCVTDHYQREVLVGFNFRAVRSSGSKVTRASLLASAAEAGNIKLLLGGWNGVFLDEISLFPFGPKDDQVDAASGAFNSLTIYQPLGGGGAPSIFDNR